MKYTLICEYPTVTIKTSFESFTLLQQAQRRALASKLASMPVQPLDPLPVTRQTYQAVIL